MQFVIFGDGEISSTRFHRQVDLRKQQDIIQSLSINLLVEFALTFFRNNLNRIFRHENENCLTARQF